MASLLDWLVENEPSFRKSRLPSLYSDLTVQKSTNPEGYAANISAWQSALTHAAIAGQLPTDEKLILQSSEELLTTLASPQYGRPAGLGLVLDDAVRTGKMLKLEGFQQSEHSIYQRSWVPSPWAVLRWGLRQTGLVGGSSYDISGRLRNGQLVLVVALEEISKQVTTLQQRRGHTVTERVMTRETFHNDLRQLSNIKLSEQDTEVLLQYLYRDKQVLSYDSNTVKFKSSTSTNPDPITTEDATIASLQTLIVKLESQISTLESRITTLASDAQAAVKKQNRQSALSALKSKKLAERSLQQRTDTLHQLEEVYSRIEQAADQIQIVEVMQTSASVLRGLNQKVGGIERVDQVVEDLREQMSQTDEVGKVLEEPLDSKAIIDEEEVDDELEAMEKEETKVREDREAEATRKQLQDLDQVEFQARAAARDKELQEKNLKSSIESLDRMSIEEDKTTKQPERVPEQAS